MRAFIGTISVVSILLSVAANAADEPADLEYQVKAAMIFNFTQFVAWPAETFASGDAPLVIGVVGGNPFGATLDQVTAFKKVGGRGVVVKYLAFPEDSIEGCNLLFVCKSLDAELGKIMQRIAGMPILTVGETEEFQRSGGIIRFFREDNKEYFEISPDAANRAHLKISSKLLKLARIYKN